VHVYVYDLTRGMARSLSPMLLGKQVGAVRTCQSRAACYLLWSTWNQHTGWVRAFQIVMSLDTS
jgi:hypothetical protein